MQVKWLVFPSPDLQLQMEVAIYRRLNKTGLSIAMIPSAVSTPHCTQFVWGKMAACTQNYMASTIRTSEGKGQALKKRYPKIYYQMLKMVPTI